MRRATARLFICPDSGVMDTKNNSGSIWKLAEPVAAALGLEVIDVEVAGGDQSHVFRVFIDRVPSGDAVSVEDCEAVSRRLGDVLDAHKEGDGRYMLEVSSPGLNRRLRKPEHFSQVIGQRVRIKTEHKIDGQRHFIGRLVAANEHTVTVDDEGSGSVDLPLAAIERANYEYDFDAGDGERH